ncbi:hypothetical protein N7451_000620 [Penicillium sp. IBT 35674x]|nr:hypothetical protein N7451_000620 [Penicillium sp. IBT 35674x]
MSQLLSNEDFDSITLLEADEHPLNKEQRSRNGQWDRICIGKPNDELNGRQVRNTVRLASQMAQF